MTPYRSTPDAKGAQQLRFAEPLSAESVLLALAIVTPLFLGAWTAESLFVGACLVAPVFVLVVVALVVLRHRAWIVMMPREERLRVVRLRAFSYSAATLRLSDAMTVECAPVGETMWIFVVAKDGRAARVIPASSSRTIERVRSAIEDALSSSEARPGTPSPR